MNTDTVILPLQKKVKRLRDRMERVSKIEQLRDSGAALDDNQFAALESKPQLEFCLSTLEPLSVDVQKNALTSLRSNVAQLMKDRMTFDFVVQFFEDSTNRSAFLKEMQSRVADGETPLVKSDDDIDALLKVYKLINPINRDEIDSVAENAARLFVDPRKKDQRVIEMIREVAMSKVYNEGPQSMTPVVEEAQIEPVEQPQETTHVAPVSEEVLPVEEKVVEAPIVEESPTEPIEEPVPKQPEFGFQVAAEPEQAPTKSDDGWLGGHKPRGRGRGRGGRGRGRGRGRRHQN
ncbi:hypothetical protein P9112_012234 [Eukaryota sp. TZLM1-RC]